MSQEKKLKEENKTNIQNNEEKTKNEDNPNEIKDSSDQKKNEDGEVQNNVSKTKLKNKFAFWFRISEEILKNQLPNKTLDTNEYESQVKKIAEFDTIEDFWAIFQHLRKPDSCKPGIEFQLFKEPIKPMWEDEYNKNGGKLTLKLRKDYTTIIWEEIILALIGAVLPEKINDEINGVVFCSKKEFNTLQIWFKTYSKSINAELEQCIRDLIQIPNEVPLELKQFAFKKEYNPKRSFNTKEDNTNYKKYDKYGGYQNNSNYDNNYKKNKGYYHKK